MDSATSSDDALNLCRSWDQPEIEAVAVADCVGEYDRAYAQDVDVVELAKVEDDHVGAIGRKANDDHFQLGCGLEIERSAQRDSPAPGLHGATHR
ncbi:MAG TPA: hypothetical protein VHW01_16160 [Polyangiaceae bacterium]|nr:hypothetical protein [Polyangiaceae bacterium]